MTTIRLILFFATNEIIAIRSPSSNRSQSINDAKLDANVVTKSRNFFYLTEHVNEAALEHTYHEGSLEKGPLHAYQSKLIFQVWRKGNLLLSSQNTPDELIATTEGYSDHTINKQSWRLLSHTSKTTDPPTIVGAQSAIRKESIRAPLTTTL